MCSLPAWTACGYTASSWWALASAAGRGQALEGAEWQDVLPAISGLLSAAGTEQALKCHRQRVGFKVPPAEGGLGRSRRCGMGFRWPAEGDKEREGEREKRGRGRREGEKRGGGGRGKKEGRKGEGEKREEGGRERERERERLAT